jgi:hypothetical protein
MGSDSRVTDALCVLPWELEWRFLTTVKMSRPGVSRERLLAPGCFSGGRLPRSRGEKDLSSLGPRAQSLDPHSCTYQLKLAGQEGKASLHERKKQRCRALPNAPQSLQLSTKAALSLGFFLWKMRPVSIAQCLV